MIQTLWNFNILQGRSIIQSYCCLTRLKCLCIRTGGWPSWSYVCVSLQDCYTEWHVKNIHRLGSISIYLSCPKRKLEFITKLSVLKTTTTSFCTVRDHSALHFTLRTWCLWRLTHFGSSDETLNKGLYK